MKKSFSGFTIIEIIVVITIVGILATIGITSFSKLQTDAQNKDRESKTAIIADALEKYFENNGVYPTCESISGESVSASEAAAILDIDPNSLTAPTAADGTNSISCNDPSSTSDTFGYMVTDQNSFSLEYYESGPGLIQSTDSRHTAYYALDTPTTPTVTASLDGSNVKATSSTVTCAGSTAQYMFSYRTNDGIDSASQGDNTKGWTEWSPWASSGGSNVWGTSDYISAVTATDGVKYSYRVKSRCYDDATHYSMSTISNDGTYTDLVSAPSAPTVSVSASGSNSIWSWSATSCTSGTSPSYQYRYTSTSGSDSGWVSTTSSPVSYNTSAVGYTYTVAVQQKCSNSNTVSSWSGSGSVATKYSLVGTIGAPSQGASGAAVTPAWGTSENRTAGNLLVCFVAVNASATIATTPAGWSVARTNTSTSTSVAIFYKIAAGGDTAPTIAAISGGIIAARLAEFTGNASSPLDKVGSNSGTTSPLAITASATDTAAPGQLVVTSTAIYYSSSGTKTLTDTINNATKITVNNASTSTRSHYDFAYGYTTANAAANSNSFSYTTTYITRANSAIASFKFR